MAARGCIAASGENAGSSGASTRAPPKNLMADFLRLKAPVVRPLCWSPSRRPRRRRFVQRTVDEGRLGRDFGADGCRTDIHTTHARSTRPTACVLLRRPPPPPVWMVSQAEQNADLHSYTICPLGPPPLSSERDGVDTSAVTTGWSSIRSWRHECLLRVCRRSFADPHGRLYSGRCHSLLRKGFHSCKGAGSWLFLTEV